MTAWDIRKYVLACDHYDTPSKDEIAEMMGSGRTLTANFAEPKRCTARFDIGFGHPRSKVRREARKRQGWVHVHESGAARQTDKDYCREHAADGTPAPIVSFDPASGRSAQDDWLHD